MKKTTKLAIKKVTLRDLDEPTLNAVAGGYPMPTPICRSLVGYSQCPACK